MTDKERLKWLSDNCYVISQCIHKKWQDKVINYRETIYSCLAMMGIASDFDGPLRDFIINCEKLNDRNKSYLLEKLGRLELCQIELDKLRRVFENERIF